MEFKPGMEQQTYAEYYKEKRPRGFSKESRMIKLERKWQKKYRSCHLMLSNQYDKLPELQSYEHKILFKEHVEVYFLSREMFIKSAWLPSVKGLYATSGFDLKKYPVFRDIEYKFYQIRMSLKFQESHSPTCSTSECRGIANKIY